MSIDIQDILYSMDCEDRFTIEEIRELSIRIDAELSEELYVVETYDLVGDYDHYMDKCGKDGDYYLVKDIEKLLEIK